MSLHKHALGSTPVFEAFTHMLKEVWVDWLNIYSKEPLVYDLWYWRVKTTDLCHDDMLLWIFLCFTHRGVSSLYLVFAECCWMTLMIYMKWYSSLMETLTHDYVILQHRTNKATVSQIALIHARFMETMLPSSDTKGKNIIYLLLKWTLTCLQACLYILVKERPFFGYIQRH